MAISLGWTIDIVTKFRSETFPSLSNQYIFVEWVTLNLSETGYRHDDNLQFNLKCHIQWPDAKNSPRRREIRKSCEYILKLEEEKG